MTYFQNIIKECFCRREGAVSSANQVLVFPAESQKASQKSKNVAKVATPYPQFAMV
jgi:hypothetical protein